jgi:prevent-host-death family protein
MANTETLSCREVKDHMAEILNRVAYNHKRYKIARHSKEMAIIISIEEWEAIERILQKLEDEEDMQEGLLALKEVKEQGSISFDEMKKRVGL